MIDYPRFIEDNFTIVNKELKTVDFILNEQQRKLCDDMRGKDVILKARQQGFSSLISAIFATDFILEENFYSVIVADIDDNSAMLLEKVKKYIESYELKTGVKVPLKYDSKSELYNPFMNSRYHIGTAKNTQFGRSRTISNLHLSEAAFYPHLSSIMAGAGQAVVKTGKFILETTANGFNEFKDFWDDAVRGQNGFTPHFFSASGFYPEEFLEYKRRELGRLFLQEYPDKPIDAFVASGDCYFNTDALAKHYDRCIEPNILVGQSVA